MCKEFFWALVLCGVFIAGVVIGVCGGSSAQQKMATAAGVGRWVIDEKTGDIAFVYGKSVVPIAPKAKQ